MRKPLLVAIMTVASAAIQASAEIPAPHGAKFMAFAPAGAKIMLLTPPFSQVELRAYGFGLIPFDGNFTRFHGSLQYDPAHPDTCEVNLDIEAASLTMANASVQSQILGPEAMDVTRFPELAFQGRCQSENTTDGHDSKVAGTLTMHGQTHKFTLDVTRQPGTITATGELRRMDWGLTARRFTVGAMIRIRMILPNPTSSAPAGTHG